MVKVIRIPETLDLSHDSDVWKLLCSRPFSRLRCGIGDRLTEEQVSFLRKEFSKFCVFVDSPLPDEEYVEQGEDLTLTMMEKASYDLMKLEVTQC